MSSSESDVDYESADEGENSSVTHKNESSKSSTLTESGSIVKSKKETDTTVKESDQFEASSVTFKHENDTQSDATENTTRNNETTSHEDDTFSGPTQSLHSEELHENDIARKDDPNLVMNNETEKNPSNCLLTEEKTLEKSVHKEVKFLTQPEDKESNNHKDSVKVEKLKFGDNTSENKDKDVIKRTVSDSEAGNRVLLFKERKTLEKTAKASSLNEKDVLDRLADAAGKEEKKSSPGWGLGNWSASFISTAASSVSTFTSQVSQGIGTVLETVEASLGVPTPEDMATNKASQTNQATNTGKPTGCTETTGSLDKQDLGTEVDQDISKGPVGSLLGGVSAFTKVFESTSSKVITGGLDTLELIGRKTMDILTEGDPGLRKKRSIFSGGNSALSQVLREARLKAEENAAHSDEQLFHYSKLFDEFQGLVHLEALEMLAERCKSNVKKQLIESENENLPSVLEHLKETCEDLPATDDTPDDEVTQDFENLLEEHCRALPFKTKIEKIKSVQCSAAAWLINCKEDQDKGEVKDPIDIYQRAISSLAELTATIMEHYHKVAELALVTSVPGVSIEECARNLTGMTTVFCMEVGILSSSFCQCLSTAADDSEDPDLVNPLITNVYLECSNSSTYIQDAFQLLIPVLQDLAIRHT